MEKLINIEYSLPKSPVRKIPLKSRSIRGFYTSTRWPRQIAFESTLERDFLILADFDPDVAKILEQPCRIDFSDDHGKAHTYTPDFLVEMAGDSAPPKLIEIKLAAELETEAEAFRCRFRAAISYATTRQWVFEVLTEDDILGIRLENAKFLLPFRRHPLDHGRSARWMNGLQQAGRSRAADLAAIVWPNPDDRSVALATLWQLISIGKIETDLNHHRVSLESEVWPNG